MDYLASPALGFASLCWSFVDESFRFCATLALVEDSKDFSALTVADVAVGDPETYECSPLFVGETWYTTLLLEKEVAPKHPVKKNKLKGNEMENRIKRIRVNIQIIIYFNIKSIYKI